MADARRLPVLKIVTSALGGIPPYTGQEPPDKYIDTLIQSWAFAEGHMTALENANAGDFDNAMSGKYAPVPANNGLVAGNPAINIPDTLRAWLRAKYQRETVGNQQSAIQRLTQEKFQQYDIPDTYETRIPLLLGVANNDAQVLGFLKSQLSGLEKRLEQIEALLAKLTRNFKSRSGQVHIATADEQSDPIFSDDNISKPEDNDYDSDNSFVESNSGNRVKCAEQSRRKDSSNRPPSTKVTNKSKPCKVEQDNNSYSTCNTLPDQGKKNSQGTKRVSLEETIRKIIQIEFKNLLPYMIQQTKNCEPALAQDKSIKSESDGFSEPVSVIPKSDEKIPELSDEEDVLDGPIEIDFVQKKEPTTSIATVKCKIGCLKIPAMALDSCAKLPIVTPDIVEHVGYGIDKSIKHDLSGIATLPIESIGVVHDLPITLAPGCTIYEDFVVVKYSKLMLIFFNSLLKKYRCTIDWDKDELKLHHNGKDFTIPVTMHKVKNKLEVNCANITPECDDSMILDCISQDLSEDDPF
ncbi:hypothetical protein RhiirC2_719669 [Rhizophagus irregularis]|uniref:Uncharacterized protein n=1 Tax=Rhizophagus irregularis TaxID=588596 RepID=A0A2N1MDE5_9GLOM|nr:hypothetical protein RhiirC2_719669 [Rhizophagus irregularis]